MRRLQLSILTCGLLAAGTAAADSDFWLGVKAGTLGLGLEATVQPVPLFDLRAGLNSFNYDTSSTYSGIPYDATLKLSSYYLTANLLIPASPLRLTAGVVSDRNRLHLNSNAATTVEIDGTAYPADQAGTLHGTLDYQGSVPYAGVGLDFRVLGRVGINIDAGLLWQGAPDVTLSADGPLASDPSFQSALENERKQLADDAGQYDLYPVISAAFSLRF